MARRRCAAPEPLALERTLPVLQTVLRRTTYLVLLWENPGALEQLLRLAEGAKGLADTLARHPILLDELLDGRSLFEPPTAERLRQALDDHVQSLAPGDLERALEELRYFKEATLLRIGACELAGAPAHGEGERCPNGPGRAALRTDPSPGLGGDPRSLWGTQGTTPGSPGRTRSAYWPTASSGVSSWAGVGFGSGLPPRPAPHGTNGGPKVVSNVQFLNRVVQRFMHFLSHRSHSGVLYEIDLRLRPGASGLLLTTFDAFERYQRERAWTFEHQALVRARPILGPAPLQARFRAFRETILAMPRPEGALREAILAMRERIREAKGGALSPVAKGFALKQDRAVSWILNSWFNILCWRGAPKILGSSHGLTSSAFSPRRGPRGGFKLP